jgi:hypothetical protein
VGIRVGCWNSLVILLLAFSACRPPGPPALTPRPLGGILIQCEPRDAQIYVDETYSGGTQHLAKEPLLLSEGVHRLEIRSEGYFSHYFEVKVVNGLRQRLKVTLRKEPY